MPDLTKYPSSVTYERVEKDRYGTYTETKYNYIDRVKKADGSYAYTTLIASKSGTASKPGRVIANNFGFNIPQGARIDSIEVQFKHYVRNPRGGTKSRPNLPNVKINLLGNSTLASKSLVTKTGPVPATASTVTHTYTPSSLGVSNETLRQVINSSSFGVYINPARNTSGNTGYYYMDYVYIKVAWSLPNWVWETTTITSISNDVKEITATFKDANGIVSSGTYPFQVILPNGLTIDSIVSSDGSLTGSTWNATIQSNHKASITFRTRLIGSPGAYTVTIIGTPSDSQLSYDFTATYSYPAPTVGTVTPQYSNTESDEYTVLPPSGGWESSTSFTAINTGGSPVKLNVYYDTTDYAGYTVTGGSFAEGSPGVWTVNASTTSTLKLKYNPQARRYIKITSTDGAITLFRRSVIPATYSKDPDMNYYEEGYGYILFPVNDTRNGEYRFKAQVKAEAQVTYPHLKVVAPGAGYIVQVRDMNGQVLKNKAFGSYNLYRDWQSIDFTFTTSNGVGEVRIYGLTSYPDWDKSKYQLNILSPTLTRVGSLEGSGGVLAFIDTDGSYQFNLEVDEKSQEYSIAPMNTSILSGKNIYGLQLEVNYDVTGEASLYLYTTNQRSEITDMRSYTLTGTGKLTIGGAGDFLGFDDEGGVFENLTQDNTLTWILENTGDTPCKVKLSGWRWSCFYSGEFIGEGLTFNGAHSSKYNMNVYEVNALLGENRSLKIYDATNTDVKLPSGWQGETRELEVKCNILGSSIKEVQDMATYISEWLSTDFWSDGGVDYGKLTFDFNDKIEWRVVRTEPIKTTTKAPGLLDVTIKFTVLEAVNPFTGMGGPAGRIRGVRAVRPTLTVVITNPNSPASIIESVSSQQMILKPQAAGSRLIIDCRRRRVTNTSGTSIPGAVDMSSDWFELRGQYDFRGSQNCKVISVNYTECY